ncbi:helix-turn-helix domain-containing protein [Marinilactibacillus kalidii]|uniref:helix-turn-helix domain-containing protein n=1 Tax=Marinilactibacillus kalidii TaxID=2820274 RepID=UPI001ABDF7A1|nr:helix-turn-helix transcriptional regulator [Marinilactibacillus kalidii]
MELGDRLKEARISKKYSQENVANHLYVTRQAISKWENNKSFLGIDNLKKLSG